MVTTAHARRIAGTLALAVSLAMLCASAAQAAAPLVGATWVTDVTATSARLNAQVTPNGKATTVRFEYITLAAYEANVKGSKDPFTGALKAPAGSATPIGSGMSEQKYLQQLGGLKSNTSYRFRLVATNIDGPTNGPTRPFMTEAIAPVFALPDSRGWEMVSPVDKNGGSIEGPEANFGGGAFQAAAQGSALTYTSSSSFATTQGSPGASQYIASRTAGGWSTENITLALFSGSYPSEPDSGAPYQLFSTNLSSGLVSNGKRCRGDGSDCPVANPPLPGSGAPAGFRNYYLRTSAGGASQALLTTAGISGLALGPEEFEVSLAGATSDLGQVVLSSCAAITANAIEVAGPEGCDPEEQNLYRWAGGTLSLVNLKPSETQGTPGAELGAASGAISSNGSRVYWSLEGDLYLREGSQSYLVDEDASFETASSDGSIAFFTKAGHLYRFAAAGKASTDLTPGGEVEGVLGASASGSRVYYLTAAGLFMREGATTTSVGSDADASNYPPATGTARVSADGSRLAFLATAPLTEYDSDGKAEVYLYSLATKTLACVSCNPTGERPLGPASIPGALANGAAFQAYKPRALLESANRLYFDTFDSLAPQDTNNDRDVYQWEAQGTGSCAKAGGCVNLISSGRSEDGARFVDASADGSDVFFTTDGSLVPSDPGSVDLYDARIGGGFPIPTTPIPCNGDACQPLPGEPEDPTPGTLLVRPEGNPPLRFPGEGSKKGGKKKGGKKGKGTKKKGGKGSKKAKAKRNRGGRR